MQFFNNGKVMYFEEYSKYKAVIRKWLHIAALGAVGALVNYFTGIVPVGEMEAMQVAMAIATLAAIQKALAKE